MEVADVFVRLVVPGALLDDKEALRVPVIRLGAAVPGSEAEPVKGALRGLPVKRAEEVRGEGAADEVLGPCHERRDVRAAGTALWQIKPRGGLQLPPEAIKRAPCGRFHLALRGARRSPVLEHPFALVDDRGVGLPEGSHHPSEDELRELQRGVSRAARRGLPEKADGIVLLPGAEHHPPEAPRGVGVAEPRQAAPGLLKLLIPGPAPGPRLLHYRPDEKLRGPVPEPVSPAGPVRFLSFRRAHVLF